MTSTAPARDSPPNWAKVVDHSRCIGCHACSTACKSENRVPLAVHRTYVKSVEIGEFPAAQRAFQVTRCNQCERPPCASICPTSAMYRRGDGIVDFDKAVCIGCKACIAACPYDAIFINPDDHAAEKCNFCAHRVDIGLEPACVVVCPTEAILVGDLRNPASKLGRIVHRDAVSVRRPEKETRPRLFYKDAKHGTLDPLAAARPAGDLFMWCEQTNGNGMRASGNPTRPNSAAPAVLSYDVPHRAPWGWKVSLYTVTKGIAAGAYLLPALLELSGSLVRANLLFRWIGPLVASFFLLLTLGLLVWDLERPARFWLIFTRPSRQSWVTRGSFILAGFGVVLGLHLAFVIAGADALASGLAWIGAPVAALAAVYTAWLFAQATARDLWQSALLPPAFLFQAVYGGAIGLIPFVHWSFGDRYAKESFAALAVLSALQILLVIGEVTLPHPTAHARLAVHEMLRGRQSRCLWVGMLLLTLACLAPWIGLPAVLFALAGLLAYEHAHVQAAQSVPLA
ncbi:MAG: 4Fe-4S dicluster domain-containing protein [Planctomycetota bacterium]